MIEQTEVLIRQTMIDISAPCIVEIQIRSDGAVLWVNVDGICRIRVCGLTPATLILDDQRNPKPRS